MDTQIEKTLSSLHSRHIHGVYIENSERTTQYILDHIPHHSVVGIGDSTTAKQIGIIQALKEKGIKVLDPFEEKRPEKDPRDSFQWHMVRLKEATICDVFLTGTNVVTEDGRLVNVDAVGNRVSGMIWGHPTSMVVVGRNKIVKDLDEAFYRIRNIIAPSHVQVRSVELGGGDTKTPCAQTGQCCDCRAIDRICNIFSIIEGKPFFTDLTVIIVNEDLGLGWDPSWPQDRITKILENYKRFVWIPVGREA